MARSTDLPRDARDAEVGLPTRPNLWRDRVRWGPIWAGLVTALTVLIILGFLAVAVGLSATTNGTQAGGPPPATMTSAALIWGVVAGIIAFFIGGFVTGRTASVFDRNWGALNGALVFLLALPITLWLAAQGLGFILGTIGNLAAALNVNVGQAVPNVSPPTVDVPAATDQVRNAAWGAFIVSVLGIIAGAIGGAVGTRRTVDAEEIRPEVVPQRVMER